MLDIQQLEKVIRNLTPTVPLNRAIWSPDDVAEYLRVAKRTVVEHYSKQPDFPKAIQLPSKGKNGQLRWKAAEVIKWAESLD